MELRADITDEKKKQEIWFCACLYFGSHDIALKDCLWLEPSVFSDARMGEYWGQVRSGADPLSAASKAGVEDELIKHGYTANLARPNEYAERIAEAQFYLGALESAQKIAKGVIDRDMQDVQAIAAQLASAAPLKPVTYHTAKTIGAEFNQELSTRTLPVIKTFVPEVDKKIGGFFPRDLIILAARPGMGKTALATQFARNVARGKKKAVIFSIEMDRRQLWARMACGLAGVDWTDVRVDAISFDQRNALTKATDDLMKMYGDYLIVVDDVFTVSGIVQAVSHINPDFVVIDHLGEIEWHDQNEKEVTWYGKAATEIRRQIGKRFGVPVLLIHQLNRGVESRDDKRPLLSDLRMSGVLEQAADVVLMMYREDYYTNDGDDSNTTVSQTELIVRKNRQGKLCTIDLSYDLKKQWFT